MEAGGQASLAAQGDAYLSAGRDLTLGTLALGRHEAIVSDARNYLTETRRSELGSQLSADGALWLEAGRDLSARAAQVEAGGALTALAGRDLRLAAGEASLAYAEARHSRRRGLIGSTTRSERHERHDIRAVGSEFSSGGDLTLISGGDQTYQAARLEAGNDLTLASGGAIAFETASDWRSESHEKSKSNFAWQSARGQGETQETRRQSELTAQGQLAIRAAEGIMIEVPELDAHSVSQAVAALAEAAPGLAWLQDMEARGDVDWREVKELHDSWAYSQSGLSEGAALAVSIVAAAAGQHYVGTVLGGGVTAGAAAGSLAGSGAVNLINHEGDLGAALSDTLSSDGLRGAALAAASAGLTQGVTDQVWGTTTDPITGATTSLDLGQVGDIGRFAGQRATQATLDAGLRSAIEGGSFQGHLGDSLEDALVHVVSGVLFHAVGDQAKANDWAEGSPEKIALHALVGGSVAEAMGGDFKTGALAAGANEALIEQLAELVNDDPTWLVTASQLVGIVAAELTDGDVHDGAEIAAQGTRYNYLSHQQIADYVEEAIGCEERGDCAEVQEKYRAISIAQQDELMALCATDAVACASNYRDLVDDAELFRDALNGLGGRDIPWQIGMDAGPLFSQYMEAEAVVSQEGFAQFLQERHGISRDHAAALAAIAASTVLPAGSRNHQMNQPENPSYQPRRNDAAAIGGRTYSGHALDRMQDRGITPSVVEDAIRNGQSYPSRGGTTVYHSPDNNVSVVVNAQGDVVTTRYGR